MSNMVLSSSISSGRYVKASRLGVAQDAMPIGLFGRAGPNALANRQFASTSFARTSNLLCRKRLSPGNVAVAAAQVAPASYAPPKAECVELEVLGGRQPIRLETGEIARQAGGAVMAVCGETHLLATACCSAAPVGDGSFVPLTVNYSERFSAAGRTSGGFVKRDGRPRDSEVLVSRLVDRPLRPMFAKGWANDTQVLEWVMSYDGVNEPEPLAITAAAAALLISDIPLKKAVAGVRVGLLPEVGLVINPTVQEMEVSRLDLMMAGTRDAVLMIEGFCDFLTEEQLIEALALGHRAIASLCDQMEVWAGRVGRPKRGDAVVGVPEQLQERLMGLVGAQLREAYRTSLSKEVRATAVAAATAKATEALAAAAEGENGAAVSYTPLQLSMALKSVESRVMRSLVLEEGVRADGRGVGDIRPISCRAGLLPRTHGSALFTRGETQALCVATLGSGSDALRPDSMRKVEAEDADSGRFYLQYHFPPSCVGETGRVGAPGRRELGHGELAQRALAPVLPPLASFPYTVRLESTITESNGSSSMASVCGGCLALMDAGVPISRPVAGIAMGLILEQQQQHEAAPPPSSPPVVRHVVLSDILGSEDALGDMDFKVAGDAEAITAFQMDIKVEGITLDIMTAALAQAREGRRHILSRMLASCQPAPAGQLSQHAPRVVRMKIDPSKVGAVIGSGGRTIKQLRESTGALEINLDDEGTVDVLAPSEASASLTQEFIQLLAGDPEPGTVLRQRPVVSLAAFGCFVEICPGRQGLVHLSELCEGQVADVGAVVRVGQLVDVMVLNSEGGKVSLSRRGVEAHDRGEVYPIRRAPVAAGEGAAAGAGERSSSSGNGRYGSMGGGRGAGRGAGGGRGGADRSRRY
ncbi:hypothetical protein Agub_g2582 [Astrephomene gubernaculifera]|uniref:polyribonucleotide nucleotidyltransferase n=1 Tax=Astrephomene gubernaculifera TaxID=47775 RepID=A0AAD3HI77_9CHLO|nr:hypothetical protein Agub_g2582 [Astrephomene gubernaculifera]